MSTGLNPVRRISPLAVLCAAQFVLQLDFSIVNVALKSIRADLDFTDSGLQWVATSYALTFGSLLLLGGRLGDLLGRRRLLIGGLLLFGLASLVGGLAPSPAVLVGARFVQGAGAAMLAPTILAELTSIYADGVERTRALGVWMAATASGGTAGLVAGGVLTQYLGWRSVFLVNLPVIAVLLPLVRSLLPGDDGRAGNRQTSLDPGGAALVTGSIAVLIFALTDGEQHGFGAARTLAGFGLSVALLVGFVVVERTVAAPLVAFSFFSTPVRRTCTLVLFVAGGTLGAYAYFLALYLQRVLGYSELKTGLVILPSPFVLMFVSSQVSRRVFNRWGLKPTLLIGLVLVTASQFCFSQVAAHSAYATGVLPGLVLVASGAGLVFPASSNGMTRDLEPREQGLAGGIIPTAQQLGGAVCLALLATLAASTTASHGSLVSGYRASYLAAACAAAVLLAVVALSDLRPQGEGRTPVACRA